MELIRVGIIEDDQTIHDSLVRSIAIYPSFELSFSAYSAEEALNKISSDKLTPDVIVLDIGLPGMNGLDALPLIKTQLEKTDIIVLTTYEESEKIFQALCSGACSYISKKTPLKVIMDSIFTVYRGGSYMSPSIARKIVQHFSPLQKEKQEEPISSMLTNRQMQIASALSEGLSYKMIAAEYDISLDTVRSHIKKMYRKLQVHSKIELINLYREGEL